MDITVFKVVQIAATYKATQDSTVNNILMMPEESLVPKVLVNSLFDTFFL